MHNFGQSQTSCTISLLGKCAEVMSVMGRRAWWLQGCIPTLLGILPYAGIKFYTYQSLKRFWADHQAHPPLPHSSLDSSLGSHPATVAAPSTQPPRPPLYVSLAFGGCAGLVAQTLTYPLDIVRRRMQVCISVSADVLHAYIASHVTMGC